MTFNRPDLPKTIKVGYLQVKVVMFIPNPLRCFKCNKCGHVNQRCNTTAKCDLCGKDKHEERCDGPKLCSNCSGPHASSSKDCPVWLKEKEIQRIRVEKRISFPEARRVIEAKSPTVVSAKVTYATMLSKPSNRSQTASVSCQTDLTWVTTPHPKPVVPLSFSFASQTIDVFPEHSVVLPKGLTATFKKPEAGSAPVVKAAKGSAVPSKIAPTGQADPPKTASKGAAGPKTVPSRDRSGSGSPRRRTSSQGVRTVVVGGSSVRIDAGGILDPDRSQQTKRPTRSPSPKMVTPDGQKRDDQGHLPLANRFDPLTQPDDDMDTSPGQNK